MNPYVGETEITQVEGRCGQNQMIQLTEEQFAQYNKTVDFLRQLRDGSKDTQSIDFSKQFDNKYTGVTLTHIPDKETFMLELAQNESGDKITVIISSNQQHAPEVIALLAGLPLDVIRNTNPNIHQHPRNSAQIRLYTSTAGTQACFVHELSVMPITDGIHIYYYGNSYELTPHSIEARMKREIPTAVGIQFPGHYKS